MQTLEIIASILGVLCVGLLIYRNHWSWPIGFAQVVLTGLVLWEAKLYAETGLQVVFAALQLYGWWAWLASARHAPASKSRADQIRVEQLTPLGSLISFLVTVAGAALLAWLLITLTDGKSPAIDAFITAASLVAQCLLAARYIENWYYWIVVDVVSIPLYVSRQLYALAVLYVVFLALAISGWYSWRKTRRQQTVGGELVA